MKLVEVIISVVAGLGLMLAATLPPARGWKPGLRRLTAALGAIALVAGLIVAAAPATAPRSTSAPGGLLYLSPTGSDSNPCTQALPCLSFDRAYHRAQPGQLVELAAGAYGDQTLNVDSGKSSATAAVVFRPAAGASVTVGNVDFYGRQIELRDMTLQGWRSFHAADHITLRRIVSGAFYLWGSSNISVLGGEVRSTTPTTTFWPMVTEQEGSGTGPPTNILFDGVFVHDWIDVDPNQSNHVDCIQFGAGVNVTIRDSRFWHCGTADLFIRSWGTMNGGTHLLRGFLIENNFFGATTNAYYSIQFGNDLGTGKADLMLRYNSFLQGVHFDTPTSQVSVISNIFSEQASWDCGASVYGHNIDETLLGSGAPCGKTDRVTPVKYVNRDALDLHLLPGSPGIDQGDPHNYPATDIDGQRRPFGRRPDVGADEVTFGAVKRVAGPASKPNTRSGSSHP